MFVRLRTYLCDQLLMQRRGRPRVEVHGAARQNTRLGVDVDGGLSDATKEELLVDDVLSMPRILLWQGFNLRRYSSFGSATPPAQEKLN